MTEKKNERDGEVADAATIDANAPIIIVNGFVFGMVSCGESIIPVIAQSEGTTIPLYSLPIGSHVLIVKASDLAGSTGSQTMLYETTTSVDSLKALVTYFADAEWINHADVANSLQGKLAKNDLKSFVNEVKDQGGKHISVQAANYLLRDAQYLTQRFMD